MNRIMTLLALVAYLLGGLLATAPAQAATTAKTQTCAKCAAHKIGAAKAKVRPSAAPASCCTGGSCCRQCPSCCQNGTCNSDACPQGCCHTASCRPGAACCD